MKGESMLFLEYISEPNIDNLFSDDRAPYMFAAVMIHGQRIEVWPASSLIVVKENDDA